MGERGEVDGAALELGLLVEASQSEEILDEHAHALGLLLDPSHCHLGAACVGCRAHPEQLGVAADRGERRAQLVRGVGEELAQAVFARLARGKRLLETVEYPVEREAETSDLGSGGRWADAV